MLTIYLIRHGETVANKRGVYYGRSDVALNDNGIEQATQLAKRLKTVSFDKVVCSQLQRSWQTAHIIAPQAKIVQMSGFDELDFGEWEGQHYQDLIRKDAQRYQAWCENWSQQAPPGGESFIQFRQRVTAAWHALLASQASGNILLVAHQGSLRLLMLIILNLPQESFWRFKFRQDAYSVLTIEQGHGVIEQINC